MPQNPASFLSERSDSHVPSPIERDDILQSDIGIGLGETSLQQTGPGAAENSASARDNSNNDKVHAAASQHDKEHHLPIGEMDDEIHAPPSQSNEAAQATVAVFRQHAFLSRRFTSNIFATIPHTVALNAEWLDRGSMSSSTSRPLFSFPVHSLALGFFFLFFQM